MVPCGDAFGRTCWKGILGYLGHCLIWISGFEVRVRLIDACDKLGHKRTDSAAILRSVRSSGVPIILIICRSWSALSLPRKRGTPEIISAKMQPHDHTSMEVLYVLEPRRTSGARYHRVTTFVRHKSGIMWRKNHITHLVRKCVHRYTKGPG